MERRLTATLKHLVPPICIDLYRKFCKKRRFLGDFPSWEAACRASGGYQSDEIIEGVKEALTKVKSGEALFERDATLFDEPDYWWPLLACLLWIGSRNGNRLSLLDFGGSLGTTYYQNLRFIDHLPDLSWSIVEQENFVQAGKQGFENEHVRFYRSVDECLAERAPDTLLLSGVLQYLEKPHEFLAGELRRGFDYVVIDRTPFLEEDAPDRLMVQQVPPLFQSSYPAWFFNRNRFLEHFSRDYRLVGEFDSFDPIYRVDVAAQSKGLLFQRKA